MVKKFFFLASFVFLLSACAPVETAVSPTVTREAGGTKEPATATVTPAPVSMLGVDAESLRGVTIMVWHPWFGVEASLFETQVADFNATNEWGIAVLTTSRLNYSELLATVTASLAAPDKPNLVIGLPEHALLWDERGGVVNLSPYVADPLWGLRTDEIADFPSVFWEQDQVGGKRLGMPAQRTTRLLLYNQTWARELGYDAPPTTSDEFSDQACAAHAAFRANSDTADDAFGGWLVDTDPMTPFAWMLAFGGSPLEGDGYRFLTPKNIEAFRFVKTLTEQGCAFLSTEISPAEAFASRRAIFVTANLEDLPAQSRALLTRSSADEWMLIPFPSAGEATMLVHGSSYIVLNADDAEQLASWLFIRWILSTENQARWVETLGMFPLRTSTLNLVADYAVSHPQWVEAVKLLPRAQGTPALASWRLVRTMLGDGFAFMFRVNLPVGQVPAILADMDRTVQDLIK